MRRVGAVLLPVLVLFLADRTSAEHTTYRIGNSLTWDSQPRAIEMLAAQRGWEHREGYHIHCGQPLQRIWEEPDEVCVEPVAEYGTFRKALTTKRWSDVVIQPYPGAESTLSTDTARILDFIRLTRENDANAETVFYIYAGWPARHLGPLRDAWRAAVADDDSTPTVLAEAYFDHLLRRVRNEADAEVRLIPVGHALAALDERIRRGEVPGFTSVAQLYRDDVHLTLDVGRYVAGITTLAALFGQRPTESTRPEGAYGKAEAISPALYRVLHDTVWRVLATRGELTGVGCPADLVDPRIGTAGSRWFFFASACRPFGLVSLSPDMDTRAWWNSGYLYHRDSICGFNHLHAWQLSGPSVMPVVGSVELTAGSDFCRSRYRHEVETARVGYHALTLEDSGVGVELTSTDRVGFHRYTFPGSARAGIVLNLGSGAGPSPVSGGELRKVGDRRIEGHLVCGPTSRRPRPCAIHFAAELDQPIDSIQGWSDDEGRGDVEALQGKDVKAVVWLAPDASRVVRLKVALSYVGVEGARRSLEAELPHWDFDRVARESRDVWNEWLGRIEVEGGSPEQRVKLYTDLWHALLGRRMVDDHGGEYCDRTGAEPVIRRIPPGPDDRPAYHHFNSDAFWTTFWNLNQLWYLAYPDVARQFVRCMIDLYRNGGMIPRGPSGGNYTFVMIAAHSTPFIVGAYMAGIRDFDVEAAYEGMRKNALPEGLMGRGHYEHSSRRGGRVDEYIELGYIPADGRPRAWDAEPAAATLEYAYDDWCLAQMAEAMGKKEDRDLFLRRARHYRNLFDRETGLMRPRNRDGSWVSPFDPLKDEKRNWCEGTAFQYTWFVPHDLAGLAELMGGPEAATRKLNDAFERSRDGRFLTPYVSYSNQPASQMAHVFNHIGAPWLSQRWVREVRERTFGGVTPDGGYPGDEDQGQMGALSAMMALGLFQMRGGASVDPVYEVTSPIFQRVRIHLDPRYYPGSTFEIVAPGASRENVYIRSASLDGKPLTRPWFHQRDLVDGGRLELQLGPEPNREWGSRPEDAPPSMSRPASKR